MGWEGDYALLRAQRLEMRLEPLGLHGMEYDIHELEFMDDE